MSPLTLSALTPPVSPLTRGGSGLTRGLGREAAVKQVRCGVPGTVLARACVPLDRDAGVRLTPWNHTKAGHLGRSGPEQSRLLVALTAIPSIGPGLLHPLDIAVRDTKGAPDSRKGCDTDAPFAT